MASVLKKAIVNLELLTDINMLLINEGGIRGGMCQAMHKYTKANNKYMENYDKSIGLSYLNVFRCKKSMRMGNVSKMICK